jgi:hypothetical protein
MFNAQRSKNSASVHFLVASPPPPYITLHVVGTCVLCCTFCLDSSLMSRRVGAAGGVVSAGKGKIIGYKCVTVIMQLLDYG